jgi:hypothetical protein
VNVFASFFNLLYSFRVRRGCEDRFCWAPSKRGLFNIRSFYCVCHDATPFPWKSIWHIKISLRVTFFAWLAALGKILTMDNLRKWHILVVDWCCMCKSMESTDHFFYIVRLLAPYRVLSSIVLGYLGLVLVDLFTCWRGLFGSPQSVVVWKMVPSCLLCCLWKERNDRSFEDRERIVVELKFFLFNTLYLWIAAFVYPNLFSFHDFIVFFFFS